jgi:glycosyltransferase involved in cell wall biosynthesis
VKILISSHAFLPSVGGLENVSAMLADEFLRKGHEVRLITQTIALEELRLPYSVIRRPRPFALLRLVRWSDIYFHNNVSVWSAWPLLFVRKPWVVAHQTWIPRDGVAGWVGRLKHLLLAQATGISISTAVACHLHTPSTVIGNPYEDSVFRAIPGIPRDKEIVFCGRLVSAKGADLLLKALSILGSKHLRPKLTIIGSGPEEPLLKAMTTAVGLADQVTFAGVKTGRELAECLNAHKIMVVPSIWQEPFGVVALEGIACGCVVVGSDGGGLKDAIGPCGVAFPNGDAEALAARLKDLISSSKSLAPYRASAVAHLSAHTKSAVAEKYLQIFDTAINGRSPEFGPVEMDRESESLNDHK